MIRVFAGALGTVIGGFAALCLYWVTDRQAPTINDVLTPVDCITETEGDNESYCRPNVVRGSRIALRYAFERVRTDCDTEYFIKLIDIEQSRDLSEQPIYARTDEQGLTASILIPNMSAPGPAELVIDRVTKCWLNPFHNWWPIVQPTLTVPLFIARERLTNDEALREELTYFFDRSLSRQVGFKLRS
jgi:hypothetical protein